MPPVELTADDSRRTLTVIVRALLGTSHRRARAAIEAGRVLVDDELAEDPVFRPAQGARVRVEDEPRRRTRSSPRLQGPGFRVVHEDDDLVAVDKSAGVLVVPTSEASEEEDPPLVARVAASLSLAGRRGGRSLWVVHRIDRDTSGLVLFARSETAYRRLRDDFRKRRPLREYLAWTEGVPERERGRLRHAIAETRRPGWRRMELVDSRSPRAREAILYYVVEAASRQPARARLRVRLVTGRRNQIRVQLAAEGWPIAGDRFYGASTAEPGRAALHAARLALRHPRSGAPLELEAPLPEELRALDAALFGGTAPDPSN
jgi:23S rRNA pseudouridine1911/1915/1917 synthase